MLIYYTQHRLCIYGVPDCPVLLKKKNKKIGRRVVLDIATDENESEKN